MITDKQVEAATAAWIAGYADPELGRHVTSPRMRAALEAAEAARAAPAASFDFENARVVPPEEIVRRIEDKQFSWGDDAAPSSAEQPSDEALNEFEAAFQCSACQRAGTDHGWRGIARFMWNAALHCEAERVSATAPGAPEADERDVFELYKLWPADVRAKLSCHDLRRMNIAARAQSAAPVSAQAGEAVARQVRSKRDGLSDYCAWEQCTKELAAEVAATGMYYARQAEARALYTTPPADARDGELAALRAFANDVIAERVQFDPDIQELAEQHGLLAQVTVSESCGDNCECAKVGFPAECYRKTAILAPADRAMRGEA